MTYNSFATYNLLIGWIFYFLNRRRGWEFQFENDSFSILWTHVCRSTPDFCSNLWTRVWRHSYNPLLLIDCCSRTWLPRQFNWLLISARGGIWTLEHLRDWIPVHFLHQWNSESSSFGQARKPTQDNYLACGRTSEH